SPAMRACLVRATSRRSSPASSTSGAEASLAQLRRLGVEARPFHPRLIPARDSLTLARRERLMTGHRRQGPTPAGAGDEQPFLETLAVRYRGALNRFFERRAARFGDTEDLTQEVFLRLATRGESERIERIDGYIFQTAASVLT